MNSPQEMPAIKIVALVRNVIKFRNAKLALELRDLGLPKPVVDRGCHFLASSSAD